MDTGDLVITIEEAREILGEPAVGMDDDTIRNWVINLDAIAVAALQDAKRRREEDALALANLIYDIYKESRSRSDRPI